MATFVLVHGARNGGWVWKFVTAHLRAAGHEVYSPTLTGLGERAHLLRPDINLDTHITDVVNVLEFEDLRDVVLVGHSYGGMVISGVAEQAVGRLAQLVFLDAYIPQDGQTGYDQLTPEDLVALLELVRTQGEGWLGPAPAPGSLADRIRDEVVRNWAEPRFRPHPMGTFAQPLRLQNSAAAALPRTYIYCTVMPGFEREAAWVRSQPHWRYRELSTFHGAPLTAPRDLADLLLSLV